MARKPSGPESPGKLMLVTASLLEKDSRSILEIHHQSKIPFYWLRNFAEKRYANPSVNRVEKLYQFLSGRELSL